MPIRHLVVTPLPNGRNGNTLHCSVHLSPRLRRNGVLSDYPDFSDWGTFVITAPALRFDPTVRRRDAAGRDGHERCRRRSIRRCGGRCSRPPRSRCWPTASATAATST